RPEVHSFDVLVARAGLEVHALGDHVAVAKPGRFLVDVIVGLVGQPLLHRPAASDRYLARRVERPEVRLGDVPARGRTPDQLRPRNELDHVLGLLDGQEGRVGGREWGGDEEWGNEGEGAHRRTSGCGRVYYPGAKWPCQAGRLRLTGFRGSC